MTNYVVIEVPSSKYNQRSFGLCESCFWCATVFGKESIDSCPLCRSPLSSIPLTVDEKYTIRVKPSLEMSFSK